MIYGYARKSPDPRRRKDRPAKLESIAVQDARIEAESAKMEGEYVCTFADDDTSGREIPCEKRDGWVALLAALKPGDIVVVTQYDRIERGGIYRMGAALHALTERGARVISLNPSEPEISDPALMELVVAIHATIARKQSEDLSRRTRESHRHAAANGYRIGDKPRLGFHWRETKVRTQRNTWQCVEEADRKVCEAMVEIERLRRKGHKVSRIAKLMDAMGIEPRPGRKWAHWVTTERTGPRYRYTHVYDAIRLIRKAREEGKTEYGGVPLIASPADSASPLALP